LLLDLRDDMAMQAGETTMTRNAQARKKSDIVRLQHTGIYGSAVGEPGD
jgi:hypothetical protein